MGRKGGYSSKAGKFSPFREFLSNSSWFGSLSPWDKVWETVSQESTRRDACLSKILREIKWTPIPKDAMQEKKASSLGWTGPWALWSTAFDGFTVLRVWIWHRFSTFPQTITEEITLAFSFSPSNMLWMEHTSVSSSAHHTCGELLAHTTRLFSQEKHTHTYANTAHGRFLQLSCLGLSLQTLKKSQFILALLLCYFHFVASGYETTGIRYALAQVRGKFMANYVLISFLAEILKLLLACTCLY